MNLTADLFSASWYWTFNGLFLLALLVAWWRLDWKVFQADSQLQHRFGFALVILVLIWSMRAGVSTGLGIHFFLVTTLHLVFGWQLAISAVFFSLLGMVWIGRESWQGIGINGWVSGMVPIICTWFLWRVQHWMRWYNPFAFIFIVAFLGAAISVVASGLLMTLIFVGAGVYPLAEVVDQFWIFVPLIALPEAVINGIFVSGLVVFKPEWVKLFDRRYLDDH
jgi:uncharacterized membrane protein